MATEIRTFGTQADDSSTGFVAWSNVTNAASSNDSRATVNLSGNSNSHLHKNTNSSHASGSTLTTSDTPTQVKYRFEKRKAGNPSANIRDWKIYEVQSGSPVTSTNYADTGTDWGTSDSVVEYTQTTNLPSAATILNSGWGVAIAVQNTNGVGSGQAELDFVDAEITFTSPVVYAATAAGTAAHATGAATCTFQPPFTATAAGTAAPATGSATCAFAANLYTGTAAPIAAHATCAASMTSTPPVFTASAACTAKGATAAASASSIYHATAAPVAAAATCAAVMVYGDPVYAGAAPMTVRAATCAAVGQTWRRGAWRYQRLTVHKSL